MPSLRAATATRPALDQQRRQHDHEGDVEKQIGGRQSDQQRDGGEKDRHRAAQADPGNEQLLAPLEAERRQAQEHRDRPRHQHQHQRDNDGAEQAVGHPLRPHQQAEQHEHHDLRQPGHGIEKHDDGIVRARLPVADHKPGQIDREESRRMHGVGEGENDQRADRDEGRVQALRQSRGG